MFKFLAILAFSLPVLAAADAKQDCRAGKYSTCSEVDLDDQEAKASFELGCIHEDGYSCTRLGQFYESKNQPKEAQEQYAKGCGLKDHYGCEFAKAESEERGKLRNKMLFEKGEKLKLVPQAIGVIKLLSQDTTSYQIEIFFPIEMIDSSDKANEPFIKDLWRGDKYPVKAPELVAFDTIGALGNIPASLFKPDLYCSDDGGQYYRPTLNLKINKTSFSHPLGKPGFVGFVKLATNTQLKKLEKPERKKRFLNGRDHMGGPIQAQLDPSTKTNGGDYDDQTLITAEKHFSIGCTGP